MDERERVATSKFLSWVLRHAPGEVGLTLDAQGWVTIDDLLAAAAAHGRKLSRADLDEIVAWNPKQRFALSDDHTRIRANQGHSVDVELGYEPATPPEHLFHGTVTAALPDIRAIGLHRMSRHHVHLSADAATARTVGLRRGHPIVLIVAANRMHRDGHAFFLSANGVWLTEHVPPPYLQIPDGV
jgi:putative RNA 2'-phosphotransferase